MAKPESFGLPTADQVNHLPEWARWYIHQLETNCDPAGTIRENVQLREQNRQLQVRLTSPEQITGFVHEGFRYTDCYGSIWQLIPQADPSCPFMIMLEFRA